MQIETLKAIIAAFNCASKDETRSNIWHVKVTARAGRVYIDATNGHMMSNVSVPDSEAAEKIGDDVFAVPHDSLPILKCLVKTKQPVVACEKVDGVLCVGVLRIDTAKKLGVVFPDFAAIVPKLTSGDLVVSFDPEYLLAMFKAMNADKERKGVVLHVKVGEKFAPITVKCGENSGVLMPCRL